MNEDIVDVEIADEDVVHFTASVMFPDGKQVSATITVPDLPLRAKSLGDQAEYCEAVAVTAVTAYKQVRRMSTPREVSF